jgi:hypothetical protein
LLYLLLELPYSCLPFDRFWWKNSSLWALNVSSSWKLLELLRVSFFAMLCLLTVSFVFLWSFIQLSFPFSVLRMICR